MAGLDLRDLAPRGHRRRRYIVPIGAVVARDMDEAVVGAHPNGLCIERRWADGVDHAEAVRHWLVDVFGGDRIECLRHLGMQAREIGADLHPCFAAIARAEDKLIGIVERVVGR